VNITKDKKLLYTIIGCSVAVLIVLFFARRVVTPFFIAFAFAYLLDPIVDRLEKYKVSRGLSVILLMFIFFLILFIGGAIFIPMFRFQVESLTESLPQYIATLQSWAQPVLDKIAVWDPEKSKEIMSSAMKKMGQLPLTLLTTATSFVWSSLSSLMSLILMVVNIFIIPVAMFYLLRDYDIFNAKIMDLVPPRYREQTLEIFSEVDKVLSGFVRGQLMVASFMSVMYVIGLYICGTPMSLFIGALAGFASLIPYLGLVVGLVPAALLTFLQFHDVSHLIAVAAVFTIVQMLEGMVITPRIVGDQIGLHPIVIMLAVLIGAEVFGLLGVFLAVPAAAVLNVLLARGIIKYKKSSLFA
jgi:predicted PurR-regulated permease PerM